MAKKEKKSSVKTDAWTTAGTFSTFQEADSRRKKISQNPDVQTKVRRRHSKNCFTVHYRNAPQPENKGKKQS